MTNITVNHLTSNTKKGINYQGEPSECPYCHHKIKPLFHGGCLKSDTELQLFYTCTNPSCLLGFVGFYQKKPGSIGFTLSHCTNGNITVSEYENQLNDLSPMFVKIMQQAETAEKMRLDQVAGMGYRKALEFLIKDYLISLGNDRDKVAKKFLGDCIQNQIQNANVKSMAERAAWLGNDESHYIRKWEDKDVDDLKKLIRVTSYWIMQEILTAEYQKSMEGGKK